MAELNGAAIAAGRKTLMIGCGGEGDPKTERAKADLDNSLFLEVVGTLEPSGAERKAFLESHPKEKEECLKNMVRVICPQYDVIETKNNSATKVNNQFYPDVLLKVFNNGILNWVCGPNSKRFRDYIENAYILGAIAELEEERLDLHFPKEIMRLLHKVESLMMGETVESDKQPENLSLDDAIEKMRADDKYCKKSDRTWEAVKNAYMMHKNTVRLDWDKDDDIPVSETIADERAQDNRIMDSDEFTMQLSSLAEIIEGNTVKTRPWRRRGYTGGLLKVLKYSNGEPIREYPAANEDYFSLFERNEDLLIDRIFDESFIKYLIETEPDLLTKMLGIGNNLFKNGMEVTNKCLTDCINESEGKELSESEVRDKLRRLGVAFSGYNIR